MALHIQFVDDSQTVAALSSKTDALNMRVYRASDDNNRIFVGKENGETTELNTFFRLNNSIIQPIDFSNLDIAVGSYATQNAVLPKSYIKSKYTGEYGIKGEVNAKTAPKGWYFESQFGTIPRGNILDIYADSSLRPDNLDDFKTGTNLGYGSKKFFNLQGESMGHWGLYRFIRIDNGGGTLKVSAKCRLDNVTIPISAEFTDFANQSFFGEEDAFIELNFYDIDGNEIAVPLNERISTTAAHQKAQFTDSGNGITYNSAFQGSSTDRWYDVNFETTVPSNAVTVRVMFYATDANNTVRALGFRQANAGVIFSDFQIQYDAGFHETSGIFKQIPSNISAFNNDANYATINQLFSGNYDDLINKPIANLFVQDLVTSNRFLLNFDGVTVPQDVFKPFFTTTNNGSPNFAGLNDGVLSYSTGSNDFWLTVNGGQWTRLFGISDTGYQSNAGGDNLEDVEEIYVNSGIFFDGGNVGFGEQEILNWNAAFGWGDHALAGYGDYNNLINTPQNISNFNNDLGYVTNGQSFSGGAAVFVGKSGTTLQFKSISGLTDISTVSSIPSVVGITNTSTINSVLGRGNNAGGNSITNVNSLGIGNTNPTQDLHVSGNVRIESDLYDSNNSAGVLNDFLVKGANGTEWQALEFVTGFSIFNDPDGTYRYVYATNFNNAYSFGFDKDFHYNEQNLGFPTYDPNNGGAHWSGGSDGNLYFHNGINWQQKQFGELSIVSENKTATAARTHNLGSWTQLHNNLYSLQATRIEFQQTQAGNLLNFASSNFLTQFTLQNSQANINSNGTQLIFDANGLNMVLPSTTPLVGQYLYVKSVVGTAANIGLRNISTAHIVNIQGFNYNEFITGSGNIGMFRVPSHLSGGIINQITYSVADGSSGSVDVQLSKNSTNIFSRTLTGSTKFVEVNSVSGSSTIATGDLISISYSTTNAGTGTDLKGLSMTIRISLP